LTYHGYRDKKKRKEYLRNYMREHRARRKLVLKETLQSMYDAKVEPVTQLRSDLEETQKLQTEILQKQGESFEVSHQIVEAGLRWAFSQLATLYLVASRTLLDVPTEDLHTILVEWFMILSMANEDKGRLLVGALLTAKRSSKRLLEYPNLDPELKTLLENTNTNIDKTADMLNDALVGQQKIRQELEDYEARLTQPGKKGAV
jgi:hypothetical protein